MVRRDDATSAQAGSDLRALYEAHVRDVYRYVHRRCGDRSLAEDVTQDVFLAAVRSSNSTVVTVGWLYQTARNRMIDVLRRRTTYRAKLRLVGTSSTELEPDHGHGIADRVHIAAALDRLSTLHRSVLMLHYVDGLTTAELATALGRSEKGAEALITRARAQLRGELEDTDV